MDKFTHTGQYRSWSIPYHMREGLTEYVARGRPPGDFLRAVLENDLMRALGRADEANMANLPAYANYLDNYAPISCRGSPKAVNAWIAHGGLAGLL